MDWFKVVGRSSRRMERLWIIKISLEYSWWLKNKNGLFDARDIL
jgi:hypothetical protein